jgi:hypothetical protein
LVWFYLVDGVLWEIFVGLEVEQGILFGLVCASDDFCLVWE